MSYLKTISRLSGTGNIGGLIELQVARKDDVLSIQAPVGGIVYGAIPLKPGRSFVSWAVTDETANAESNSRNSREGSSRSNRIPFSVPKDRDDLLEMFEKASKDELIVLFKDANGKQKIFGSLSKPVQFEYKQSSGAGRADKNGFQCSFFYDGPQNMFEYFGSIASAPPGGVNTIYFNGVAIAVLAKGENFFIVSDFGFQEFYVTQ